MPTNMDPVLAKEKQDKSKAFLLEGGTDVHENHLVLEQMQYNYDLIPLNQMSCLCLGNRYQIP